jgi:hypothetical protein
LDPSIDYTKFKASVLKQLVKDKGIECKVQFLIAAIVRQKAAVKICG